MDKVKPKYMLYAGVWFALIVVDQLTKYWIFERFLRREGDAPSLIEWLVQFQPLEQTIASYETFGVVKVTSWLNMVAVWNTGVSFGLLDDAGDHMPMILSIFGGVVGLALIFWAIKATHPLERLATVVISAGALGNVWDRLRFKAVADFVDVHVAGHHWPAFNVADSAICLGAVLLVVYILKYDSIEKKQVGDD